MDIGLLSLLNIRIVDFHPGLVQGYANALRNAMELHVSGEEKEKQKGFYLSAKRGLQDKLYVGNIHRIENHLYWNDEELADDDQIVNVVVIEGPVTRDGGACSYGSKDHRDQIMYANTIPQVVGHLFLINTPGGESAARIDYEQAFEHCHACGKPTVAFVDGLCASMGVNIASRCDRTIVMHGKDEYGCIGSMAAFWATPDGAIDSRDGSRWVEIVGDESPEKNAWWREAAKGEYDKLKAMVNESTNEFHESVRANRPLVTEAMMNGDIFKAQDVIPALVDEIGDYNRAIECVFELADKKLEAARFATAESYREGNHDEPDDEPGDEPDGKPDDEPGEQQKDMAKLSDQQKQAVATSRGDLMMVDDGHVTTDVQTIFGPEEVEIAKPQNDNNMTKDEKKAADVQEAQVAEQETVEVAPTSQPAEKAPAQDEKPAQEEQEAAAEEIPVTEEAPATEEVTEAEDETGKMAETLQNAEQMVADRDKQIAELQESLSLMEGMKEERDEANAKIDALHSQLEERDATIAERDASIATLKKKVADLQNEVKELSEKPAPMTNAASGVPADNATGEKQQENQHQRIKPGMTYEQIRKAMKH